MPELRQEDLRKVLASLPGDLVNVLYHARGVLAGGYIRDTLIGVEPSDVDVFVARQPEEMAQWLLQIHLEGLKVAPLGKKTLIEAHYLTTPPIQFIYRPNPAEFIQNGFDYTINCAMIDFSYSCPPTPMHTWVHQDFYAHLAARQLVLANEKALRSRNAIHRMMRHAAKGFVAGDTTIAKVVGATMAGALAKDGMVVNEETLNTALLGLWGASAQKALATPKKVVVGAEQEVDLGRRQRIEPHAWRLEELEEGYDQDRREARERAEAAQRDVEDGREPQERG